MLDNDKEVAPVEEKQLIAEESPGLAEPRCPKPECGRSGQCCHFVLLDMSPRRLWEDYADWSKNPNLKYSDARAIHFDDIHLVYPMLTGHCRGKWVNPHCGTVRYVYGCKHISLKEDESVCTIHEIRPQMCRAYPFYGKQPMEMGAVAQDANPGYMRGCGYNTDPDAGFSPGDILDGLEELSDDEKEPLPR
jgi:hypothetical protein